MLSTQREKNSYAMSVVGSLDHMRDYIFKYGAEEDKQQLKQIMENKEEIGGDHVNGVLKKVHSRRDTSADTKDKILKAVIEAIKINRPNYLPFIRLVIKHKDEVDLSKWSAFRSISEERTKLIRQGGLKESIELEIYFNFVKQVMKELSGLLSLEIGRNSNNERLITLATNNGKEEEKNSLNSIEKNNKYDALNKKIFSVIKEIKIMMEKGLEERLKGALRDFPEKDRVEYLNNAKNYFNSLIVNNQFALQETELKRSKYYLLPEDDLKDKLQVIKKQQRYAEIAASACLNKYTQDFNKFEERANMLAEEKNNARRKIIDTILLKKDGVQVNIPPSFRDNQLTAEELKKYVGKVDPHSLDEHGNTLLSLAIQTKNQEVRKFLQKECHPDMHVPNDNGYEGCVYFWAQSNPKSATIALYQLNMDQELKALENSLRSYLDNCDKRKRKVPGILHKLKSILHLNKSDVSIDEKISKVEKALEEIEERRYSSDDTELQTFLSNFKQQFASLINQGDSQHKKPMKDFVKKMEKHKKQLVVSGSAQNEKENQLWEIKYKMQKKYVRSLEEKLAKHEQLVKLSQSKSENIQSMSKELEKKRLAIASEPEQTEEFHEIPLDDRTSKVGLKLG